jgi:hypothetical protein
MKTLTTTFRGQRAELIYSSTDRGINLSWIGNPNKNLIDTITKEERNELIMLIITTK